jgi:hypothetical protein
MKNKVKISIFIALVIILSAISVKAATVIGETISTAGLTVSGNSIFEGISRFKDSILITNELTDEGGVELKIDGTYATTSMATMQLTGTTSRIMITSGESSWPTTWSFGINTGLEGESNQDFQIRQIGNGESLYSLVALVIEKNSGNVGIGTTTPQYNLSVDGSILATNSLRVGEGNEFMTTNYQSGLGFWTNGSHKMTLDSSGNLGLGSTAPLSRLEVVGIGSDNTTYSLDVINGDNNSLLHVRNDGKVFIGKEKTTAIADKLTISDASSARLKLEAPLAGINIISDTVGDLFIQGSQSAMTSYYRDDDYRWTTGMTGSSNNNFTVWFSGISNPGSRLSITPSGYIGIGTTTPLTNLHVFDDTANTQITVEGYNPMLRFTDTLADVNNKNWSINAYRDTFKASVNPDNWAGGSTPWLEVKRSGEADIASVAFPNGNVGIGTTTPESTLEVNGGITPGKVVADPCASLGYQEGAIFYNDVSNYFCYCDGTDDVQLHDPTTACF